MLSKSCLIEVTRATFITLYSRNSKSLGSCEPGTRLKTKYIFIFICYNKSQYHSPTPCSLWSQLSFNCACSPVLSLLNPASFLPLPWGLFSRHLLKTYTAQICSWENPSGNTHWTHFLNEVWPLLSCIRTWPSGIYGLRQRNNNIDNKKAKTDLRFTLCRAQFQRFYMYQLI